MKNAPLLASGWRDYPYVQVTGGGQVGDNALELYSGIGLFTLPLAKLEK